MRILIFLFLILVFIISGCSKPADNAVDTTTPTPSLKATTALTVKPTATPKPSPSPTPSYLTYNAGQYKAGIDIPAGEYMLFSEGDSGYFCISSDANGDNIIKNDNFATNSIITIKDNDYLELTRCKAIQFDKAPMIEPVGGFLPEGMYLVGYHLPGKEYKIYATSDSGYYCVYNTSRRDKIVSNGNFSGERYVTVNDGQYLLLTRVKIKVD